MLSIEAAFSLNLKEDTSTIELFGTKAGAKISPKLEIFGETHHYLVNTSFAAPTALDFDGLFEAEINHYIDCITGKSKVCKSPAEDGVILMKILEAVYESARTGHEVILG